MRVFRTLTVVLGVVALLVVGAVPAFAHEGGSDFVCPVWNPNSQAGAENPDAHPIGGGDHTIIPGENTGKQRANHLDIPDQATNGDGTGSLGDPDYSAIWNVD